MYTYIIYNNTNTTCTMCTTRVYGVLSTMCAMCSMCAICAVCTLKVLEIIPSAHIGAKGFPKGVAALEGNSTLGEVFLRAQANTGNPL